MKNKTYRYFISYSFAAEDKAGMSNVEIPLGKPISCMNDIRYFQTYIKNKFKYDEVVVIDFRLLGIEEGN